MVMVMTKMNWSGPNVIHFGRKLQFEPDQFIFIVTISFWSRPNHYGQVQINLVRPKPFWTDQNCFGHIKGQGISLDKNEMVTTKMNWSGPNCDFIPKWITFGPDQFIWVVTISFWSGPNRYGQLQINLVRPKPFWTDQNCFGHIEGHDIWDL